MYKKSNKLTKAQTALEYIAASLVFAGVGVGVFFGIDQFLESNQADLFENRAALLDKTLAGAGGEQGGPGSGTIPQDIIDSGAGQVSDWDESQEQDQLAGTDVSSFEPGEDSLGISLPEVQESYEPSQLQTEFESLTGTSDQNLNDDWFMNPPDMSLPEGS